jgi:UDP-N-acetylglucosamine acyltransferase
MEQHPTAIVSKKAQIGTDVKIGPFSIVEDDVIIGDGCFIDSHVSIKSGVTMGKNIKVFHGSAIGGPPQDLKYAGERTELIIGDNTVLREFVDLNRGTVAHGRTEIGKVCFFMAYSHAAHDCVIGDSVIMANSVNMGGHVSIGNYTIIGGLTAIHQFCKIGDYCMVGAGFKISQDVLPYTMVAGYPVKCKGLNLIGLRRRGFSPETINTLKKTMRILMSPKLNTTQALRQIDNEIEKIPEVLNVLKFIEDSDRGVYK